MIYTNWDNPESSEHSTYQKAWDNRLIALLVVLSVVAVYLDPLLLPVVFLIITVPAILFVGMLGLAIAAFVLLWVGAFLSGERVEDWL